MSRELSFTPIADTYLMRTSPIYRELNFGGADTTQCGPQRAMLLRFRISGIPSGSVVQSVTLTLTKADWANTGTNYLRELTTHTWTEYGATDAMAVFDRVYWACGSYDPYDKLQGFCSGMDYGSTNISTVNSNSADPNGTEYTFPSTTAFVALLQDFVGTTADCELCIPNGVGFVCQARQGSYPPLLTVTFQLPSPLITSFSPQSTTATGTTITMDGENFGCADSDLENIQLINQGQGSDYDLSNQIWTSSQQVKGDVPGAAQPGTYRLRVTIDGQSCDSQETFDYNSPGPLVTSINPSSAKPSQIPVLTISGSGFEAPVIEVSFVGQATQGERSAAGFTRVSSTEITATAPSNLASGSYKLRITANGLSSVSGQTFRCKLGPATW